MHGAAAGPRRGPGGVRQCRAASGDEDVTADFVYIRLHGDTELYTSGYGELALDRWARRIERWHAGGEPRDAARSAPRAPVARGGRDVYCYFDNDAKVHAPFDAQALHARLR